MLTIAAISGSSRLCLDAGQNGPPKKFHIRFVEVGVCHVSLLFSLECDVPTIVMDMLTARTSRAIRVTEQTDDLISWCGGGDLPENNCASFVYHGPSGVKFSRIWAQVRHKWRCGSCHSVALITLCTRHPCAGNGVLTVCTHVSIVVFLLEHHKSETK